MYHTSGALASISAMKTRKKMTSRLKKMRQSARERSTKRERAQETSHEDMVRAILDLTRGVPEKTPTEQLPVHQKTLGEEPLKVYVLDVPTPRLKGVANTAATPVSDAPSAAAERAQDATAAKRAEEEVVAANRIVFLGREQKSADRASRSGVCTTRQGHSLRLVQ